MLTTDILKSKEKLKMGEKNTIRYFIKMYPMKIDKFPCPNE